MYDLKAKVHFDAAHRLRGYAGKCNREHGHRWEIEVCVRGEVLDGVNILVDFSKVKAAVKNLVDMCLDHYQLNETLKENNPTAEFLAKWVYEHLVDWFREVQLSRSGTYPKLVWVCVWESPECCVAYSPRGVDDQAK